MLIKDDCLKAMMALTENSIDALITDPPAGIGFMNKDWDKDKGGRDQWIKWMTEVMREAFHVLKPGAHGLVWALPRTSHWTATALENAGFEVRDIVTHLFGSGFPKSLDISKAIDKASGAEREIVNTYVKSVGDHHYDNGTKMGRFGSQAGCYSAAEIAVTTPSTDEAKQWQGWGTALKPASEHWILIRKPLSEKTIAANVLKWGTGGINIDQCRVEPQGRWPSNLVLDEEAAKLLDEQVGHLVGAGNKIGTPKKAGTAFGDEQTQINIKYDNGGGASRFFYCAKASKKDRAEDNSHPTVKSTKLMEYLIKLITPPGGTILDPFMGSGSTGVAAKRLGFNFIGIEEDQSYFEIAEKRINA